MQNLETMEKASSDSPVGESDGQMRIVRAAYPLFVDLGYGSVSMQQIADAVPVHKATLYHHFQNKEELFVAVVRVAMRRLHVQILEFVQAGGSAADQLTRVAAQIFRESQSEFGRLMDDVNQHLTLEQRQWLSDKCGDPWALYEQIFASAVAAEELREVDPTLATTMFVGLLYGQTWSLKIGRIDTTLDEARARLVVDTLFAGLNSTFAKTPGTASH